MNKITIKRRILAHIAGMLGYDLEEWTVIAKREQTFEYPDPDITDAEMDQVDKVIEQIIEEFNRRSQNA